MGPRWGAHPREVASAPHLGGKWAGFRSYAWAMTGSPLDPHVGTPAQLRERILAERRGTPFLLFRDAEERQVIVDLDDARDRVTIGRRASSDVALEWDAGVSRLHAELIRVGADWLVCDEGISHNGTFVGGERLHGRRRLRDGDVITIGETLIAYCAPDPRSSSSPTVTTQQPLAVTDLTPAQRRVLMALCRPYRDAGYTVPASNRQIADELVVSVDTVKGTLGQLFETFGLEGLPPNQKRATLAMQAIRTGVVSRRDL
jgi:pSer/pThr/pTyr-binding forkhead associated (FHA) protein